MAKASRGSGAARSESTAPPVYNNPNLSEDGGSKSGGACDPPPPYPGSNQQPTNPGYEDNAMHHEHKVGFGDTANAAIFIDLGVRCVVNAVRIFPSASNCYGWKWLDGLVGGVSGGMFGSALGAAIGGIYGLVKYGIDDQHCKHMTVQSAVGSALGGLVIGSFAGAILGYENHHYYHQHIGEKPEVLIDKQNVYVHAATISTTSTSVCLCSVSAACIYTSSYTEPEPVHTSHWWFW